LFIVQNVGKIKTLKKRFVAGVRSLGRPRHRWEDNVRMDLQEVGWGYGLDWAGSG
jgi:hypothetical protein